VSHFGTSQSTDGAGTPSERYLARLCRHSFLRLWSYPRVYKDQKGHGAVGKEVCDLLVVCDRHVVVFSDKYCAFPNGGNPQLDWSRWFKRAVWKSAGQVWGAERWIREYPDRLFLDPHCQQPIPVRVPRASEAVFHRVVVAHGSGPRCREALGGSGSLMIVPEIVGDAHFTPIEKVKPFAVGRLSTSRGFVHIVDDFSLDVVLRTVDTIADFARYLEEKECLISSGRLMFAAGEEELLGQYLLDADASGKHGFALPPDGAVLALQEGFWETFQGHPDRLAQIEANRVSYAWDKLLDTFAKHMLGGTQHYSSALAAEDPDAGLRLMAREPRTRRRILAQSLIAVVERGSLELRAARVALPSSPGDPHYVFLTLRRSPDVTYERYREVRRDLLAAYCMVTRRKWKDAVHVVGIATEPADSAGGRSEDLAYIDGTRWNEALDAEAERVERDLHIFHKVRRDAQREPEYPRERDAEYAKGRNRNRLCYCASGKKYKKCHGARRGRGTG